MAWEKMRPDTFQIDSGTSWRLGGNVVQKAEVSFQKVSSLICMINMSKRLSEAKKSP